MNTAANNGQLPTILRPDVNGTPHRITSHEIESLCSTMLWLRAWWESHSNAIRAADPRAAACVHDYFIDGAIFARSIADKGGFELNEDRMRNYTWGRSIQTFRMVGGAN